MAASDISHIPMPADRFYCVYAHGLGEYNSRSLTACMRYIAKQFGSVPSKVTAKQAVAAGFTIKAV